MLLLFTSIKLIIEDDSACHKCNITNEKKQYLVEAQVVLNGVRGVEDGPAGSDNQDKPIESLWSNNTKG